MLGSPGGDVFTLLTLVPLCAFAGVAVVLRVVHAICGR